MNLSLRWLEAFLGRQLDPQETADRLAMLVAPVDAIESLHAELAEVVVGLVEEVRAHPNADRLRLCLVNDGGDERRHVVCGAPNVAAGVRYPFARVGTTLPGGLTLEKRKIRGELSEGMLCSARELGLGEDHDGIMALEGEFAPGTPFLEALQLGDHRLLLDVTPNRGDLLGHKAVARELAAALDIPFRLPKLPGPATEQPELARVAEASGRTAGIEVAIEDAGCGRFAAAVVRGIRIGPSPEWLRRRLEGVGVRSINNVVDATNYVLFELGQPLHAYDLATLRGGRIVARAAAEGETLTTLDGVARTLSAGTLIIADGERPVGIAGVMGGAETEVTDGTSDILLECAWFQPARVRAARRAHGIVSEAAHRFERGVDRWNLPEAIRRCLEVIALTAGGTLDGLVVDVWPEQGHPPRVFLRRSRVTQVLGVELPLREIERCLVAIGAAVVAKPEDDRLAVEVPGWRTDLTEEIDLVEEVARVYGYQRIPSDLPPFRVGASVDAPLDAAADRVRRGLVAEGLLEAVTLPLVRDAGADGIPLQNPLSADHGFLRNALLPGLVREVERNWAAQARGIRLFEIGTAFLPPAQPGGRPLEETRVAVVVTGPREPGHWSSSGKAPEWDRWDLKHLLETTLELAHPAAVVRHEGEAWIASAPDGVRVGWAGSLRADAPRWAAPLWGLEVTMVTAPAVPVTFRRYPVTPAAERDLALVVPDRVAAGDVLTTAGKSGGKLLESVSVVDEYRGSHVPAGTRSLAIRLVFRAGDRTLRDQEIETAVSQAVTALERTHDIVLRTS